MRDKGLEVGRELVGKGDRHGVRDPTGQTLVGESHAVGDAQIDGHLEVGPVLHWISNERRVETEFTQPLLMLRSDVEWGVRVGVGQDVIEIRVALH